MSEQRALAELLTDVAIAECCGAADRVVSGLSYHTHAVQPGGIFVALRGTAADGHRFVPQAVSRGARVVVVEQRLELPTEVTQVVVANTRLALAQLAAAWFRYPTRALRLIGVTGTNGKTTLTYLLESIWRAAGRQPGVLGTVNYRYGDQRVAAATTTPESYEVQRWCRVMCDAGVTDLAMEVSSHGLEQERVHACHFDGAIFTNLSQDHLDYHADMAAYAAAKRRLFAEVLPASAKSVFAVVNAEDAASAAMIAGVPYRTLSFGMQQADVYPRQWQTDLRGLRAVVQTPRQTLAIQSPLVGQFNLLNILAAVATAEAMDIPVPAITAGLAAVAQVPGRMERVADTGAVTVMVDYAHTPAALQNLVATLRPLTSGRLITVFGCGGDRDPGKRPLMGSATAASNFVVVTSDNPRTEDPEAIIAAILPGLRGVAHEVVVDRRAAIHRALAWARAGDVVAIAGKGHEDYQIIGTTKRPFDDRDVVREYFAERELGHAVSTH